MFKYILFKLRGKNDFEILIYTFILQQIISILINYLGFKNIYKNPIVIESDFSIIQHIYIIIGVLRSASGEEFIFRLIPLFLIVYVLKYSKYDNKILFIIFISSVIFGLLHGNIINIFSQGIMGFSLFIIFYRNFLYTNDLSFSFIKVSLIHFCINYFFSINTFNLII